MTTSNYFYPKWNVPANIKSIQTQRQSGSSNGCFSSFNLSYDVGDDPESVRRNLLTLNSILPSNPYWLNQIHENIALELPCDKNLLNADASYTMIVANKNSAAGAMPFSPIPAPLPPAIPAT